MQVLTVTDLAVDFAHGAQVTKIVRHRTDTRTGKRSRETVYVLTGLTSQQEAPQDIAKIVRSQWVIENRLHFARDVTFAEDAFANHTGRGPDNTWPPSGAWRSTTCAQRDTNIAAALRDMSYEPFTGPLHLLKIG